MVSEHFLLTRRAIDASPALRSVVKAPTTQHVIQTWRACRITRSLRFALGQLTSRTSSYRPHGHQARIAVRHRTRDVAILIEVFGPRLSYEPPAAVAALLDGPITVLDLGGNVGHFGVFALNRWTVSKLVSYEPDPANLKLLHLTAGKHPEWDVIAAAAANYDGTMLFKVGWQSESREAREGERWAASKVTAIDVLDSHTPFTLAKIDIEGGEWRLLRDPRVSGLARVIVLEWHGHGFDDDAHAENTARQLLREAGYACQWAPEDDVTGNGILWAWQG